MATVSESIVPKVKAYIQNQEEHHMAKSFIVEDEEFLGDFTLDG